MSNATSIPTAALRYEFDVPEGGRVELRVPFSRGTRVVVFVVEEAAESFGDLTAAAQSSLSFWDNALDDEDWTT
jgi:hypothetical protein